MHYHPTVATALAQTRVADLHETAGRAQQARRTLNARPPSSSAQSPSMPTRGSSAYRYAFERSAPTSRRT
jgi:hypothetical protein